MTETVESLSNDWKITWLCKYLLRKKKKNSMWYINFSLSVSQNVYLSFPSPAPATNQCCGGSQAPFKNRTWYYRGISKWPVKNKGVPRSSSLQAHALASTFFGNCCLMWLVQTVSDLKRNTSRPCLHRKDWKEAWKSGAHFGSQTRTSVQCVGLRLNSTRQPLRLDKMLLIVHIKMMCHFDSVSESYFQYQSWQTDFNEWSN